jgi:hypothetical protein
MKPLSRGFSLLIASSAAIMGTSITAPPAALADTTAIAATLTAGPSTAEPRRCQPAHQGAEWRWHNDSDSAHWDQWEWNRWRHSGEWKHHWRDNHRCDEP